MPNGAREESFTSFFATATGGFKSDCWPLQVALYGVPNVVTVPGSLEEAEVAWSWAWLRQVQGDTEPPHLV
jgi:hypothetical protein